jgi:hypothetical protein
MPAFNEILTVGDGNFTAFTTRPHITDDIIVEILTSSQAGSGIVSTTIGNGIAIKGVGGTGIGVRGESDVGFGFLAGRDPVFHEAAGVYGESAQAGVFGNSNSADGTGLHGRGGGAGGFGVRGEISGNGAAAIRGQVFGSGNALAGQFDGNVEVTGNLTMRGGGDVILGDCAEEFECVVEGGAAERGDVMVLDDFGAISPCSKAYDTRAVGVVSGAGPFRPAIILDRVEDAANRAPIALIGKVCCNVDADFAPIRVGDLLTSSPTVGHAMKAADPQAAFGAVIGKAIEPMDEGRGQIRILVTLQ